MKIDIIITYCKTQPAGLHTFTSLNKATIFRNEVEPEIFETVSRVFLEECSLCIIYVVKPKVDIATALDSYALPDDLVALLQSRDTGISMISMRMVGHLGHVAHLDRLADIVQDKVNSIEQLRGSVVTAILE